MWKRSNFFRKLSALEHHWYATQRNGWVILLLPFSWLFRAIIAVRYFLYRYQIKKVTHFSVPIIVVGNLTVGGTGKTPFVIWLAHYLQKQGYRPGIVSRGVGGKKSRVPCWVDDNANPAEVGDEAVLLRQRTCCPMVVALDRVMAVKELLKKTDCNIVISDDGLQHYRLARDFEVVIVDGMRRFGNGALLPAGPLRESISRLQRADLIVINGEDIFFANAESMQLQGDKAVSMQHPQQVQSIQHWQNQTVHVIAGIGHPERFFATLRKNKINTIEHVFPDHYLYQRDDIYFADDLPILMTEKDAVKCYAFADQRHWYLPVTAQMSQGVEAKIDQLLKKQGEKRCVI